MSHSESVDAVVVGAGPAGLMAAQQLSLRGRKVIVAEAMPSPGRKLLMAGKSGLNISKAEPLDKLLPNYYEAADQLQPMLRDFDPEQVQLWAQELGQELFIGSSGRVFPKSMKASPLLRAWLSRLNQQGVELRRRWKLTAIDGNHLQFDTPEGSATIHADTTILALGGASWSKLGSDGSWSTVLERHGVSTSAFAAANAALNVGWSQHMEPHFGAPIKSVGLTSGPYKSRGEFVLSSKGLEGGGIYSITKGIREGHSLQLDLFPDTSLEKLQQKLSRPKGKASLSNYLRKTLHLDGARMALARELAKPLPSQVYLAKTLKNLSIENATIAEMDQAISTAGGVPFSELDKTLMLKKMPSVFCCGEMLDWEAPTGGYLITGSLATGRWAGLAAEAFLTDSKGD